MSQEFLDTSDHQQLGWTVWLLVKADIKEIIKTQHYWSVVSRFPSQRASNAVSVSMSWHHNEHHCATKPQVPNWLACLHAHWLADRRPALIDWLVRDQLSLAGWSETSSHWLADQRPTLIGWLIRDQLSLAGWSETSSHWLADQRPALIGWLVRAQLSLAGWSETSSHLLADQRPALIGWLIRDQLSLAGWSETSSHWLASQRPALIGWLIRDQFSLASTHGYHWHVATETRLHLESLEVCCGSKTWLI